jgi:glutathione S-transferase
MVKYILPKLWNRWGDDELRKQAERRPTKFYRDVRGRAVRGEITERELGAARATIDELLDHLEHTLVPGPRVVGDQFTLAEISIAPYMFRLAALGADQFWSRQRRPRVKPWYDNLAARPAFKTVVSWPDESSGCYEEVGLGAKVKGA